MTATLPPTASARSALLFGLLAVSALTAGCTLLEDTDGQELPSADAVETTVDDLHAVEATMVSRMDGGATPNETRLEMVARPDTGEFRGEVHAPEGQAGTIMVSNGTTMSLYNRTANEVRIVDVSGLTDLNDGSMDSVVAVFEHLNAQSANAETPEDVSTLPVIPAGASGGAGSVTSLPLYGNASFTYEGTGTVDGRDAYEVRVVPQDEEPLVSNYRLWLDAEWYYPLKTTGQVEIDGTNRTVSMVYRNVTFNPGVADETFEFEPPANATVVDAGNTSFEDYESRADLAAGANRTLPEPSVPSDFEFESGIRFDQDGGEQVSLRYENDSARVSVMVQPNGSASASPAGEVIEVDGRSATITTIADTIAVRLRCGTETYVVTGTVSRETATDVAASLVCGDEATGER